MRVWKLIKVTELFSYMLSPLGGTGGSLCFHFCVLSDTVHHLTWWFRRENFLSGVQLHSPRAILVIHTGASTEGWGALCTHHMAQDNGLSAAYSPHQCFGVEASVTSTPSMYQIQTVTTCTYGFRQLNSCGIHKQQGGTRSWTLCALLWRILVWTQLRGITLTARHIPGCLNVIADQLSCKGQALHTEWSLHPQVCSHTCQMH